MSLLDRLRAKRALWPDRPLSERRPVQHPDENLRSDTHGRHHLRQIIGSHHLHPDPVFEIREPEVVTQETAAAFEAVKRHLPSPELLRFQEVFDLGALKQVNHRGGHRRTYVFERGALIEHALFTDSRGHVREVQLNRRDQPALSLRGEWLHTVERLGLGRLTGVEEQSHPLSGKTETIARFERGVAYLEQKPRDREPILRELVLGEGARQVRVPAREGLLVAAADFARQKHLGAYRDAKLDAGNPVFEFENGRLELYRSKRGSWSQVTTLTGDPSLWK